MEASSTREQQREAMRARIAETALQLFVSQGYTDTTVDQIAAVAGVGRRTIFRHFPTKEAMLIDHLVVRHEFLVRSLAERPAGEPALASLNAAQRALSERGYDRKLIAQVRAVLASDPDAVSGELTISLREFEREVVAVLVERDRDGCTEAELRTLVLMAFSWLDAAVRTYLFDGRDSLVECYDEVVALCVAASAAELGALIPPTD